MLGLAAASLLESIGQSTYTGKLLAFTYRHSKRSSRTHTRANKFYIYINIYNVCIYIAREICSRVLFTLWQVDAEDIGAIVPRYLASISIDLWIIVIDPRDYSGQCRFTRIRTRDSGDLPFRERSRVISWSLARGEKRSRSLDPT